MESWKLSSTEATVFLSGVVSMGLEMVAGRILAPEFGSSVYTWGSIIGVFMAALALGYHYGGKKAAEADRRSISILFLATAFYIAALLAVSDQVLALARTIPLGSRYISLLPATVLFGPPAFLLGFVSPYAAQLSAVNQKGEASGRVYALGTAGSIIGTFAATFVLIPYLSVELVLATMAAASLVGTVISSWNTEHLASSSAFALLSLLGIGTVLLAVSPGITGATYATQTPYQQLEIRDSSGVRTLYLNNQPQSAAYLNGSTSYPWRYPRYFHMPFLMTEEENQIENVLFIGAGGFSGPRRFAEEYNVSIDIVEIDPGVVEAGKRYFNASSIENSEIHVEDGRRFLRKSNETYDLIVMDAYRKSSVPFHLTTVEFMELADSKMSEHGIFYANLISSPSGPGSKLYRAEFRTAEQVFPQVYSFRTSASPFAQNIELIATKNPERVTVDQLQRRNRERYIGFNLSSEIDTLMERPETSDVPVLRDDRAPVERLTDPLVGTRYEIEGRQN